MYGGGRKRLTRAVPVLVVVLAAVGVFMYFRYYPRLTPQEAIRRYIDLIPQHERDFAAAVSDGLDPGDVRVVGSILSRLDRVRAKVRSLQDGEEIRSLMNDHSRAALALEVEMMRTVRARLSQASKEVAWIDNNYRDELIPEKVKDFYGQVVEDYKLFRAFGGGYRVAEAKSLLENLTDHYRFATVLLAYRQEVETLLRDVVRPRDLRRAERIIDKLSSLRLRLPAGLGAVDTKRRDAVVVLTRHIIEQIGQVKRNTRERLKLIFAAYPYENQLSILYEYQLELPRLRSTLLALGLEEEAREIKYVMQSLATRLEEYEEIEDAEEALAVIHDEMVAFGKELGKMLADGLQARDAKKCVAMQRGLEKNFVVFRQGEKESFKQAHSNILLMHSLYSAITREVARWISLMMENVIEIREGYSKTKDVGVLRDQMALVKGHLKVFKAARRKGEISQARGAIKELDKRIDFLKHYDERMAILEVKKAEIESLRLTIDSIFKDKLTADDVPKINKAKRSLERYKKYDPWVEGGIFRERVELVTYIDGLIANRLDQKAARLRMLRMAFFKAHNRDIATGQLAEVEEYAGLFGALKRDELEEEAWRLKREIEYFMRIEDQLGAWLAEFRKLMDDPFDMFGRPTRGLQAGDVKKLTKTLAVIEKERVQADRALAKDNANEKMLSSLKSELLKLRTEISQAIEDRLDEAERRVGEITSSLPETGSVERIKELIAELEDAYGVLKIRRPGVAVSAKAAVAKARKRREQIERAAR
jgi:hypothetical protein